ncbi:MAG: hypothetical protein IPP77_05315 [Bacteroidetes bacterium]|nr:hypothetical protein [Bacteroidota bacterium]
MKWFFPFFLLAFMGLSDAFSQSLIRKNLDLQDYQYKKEASGGVRVQTNGFSVFGEGGWIKDLKSTRLIQVEYSYYIDYRQKGKSSDNGGRKFVYGLRNRFHILRFSAGMKKTIADKADRNGLRLSFVGFGGISLGLLKPYYLLLRQPTDVPPYFADERYTDENATRFLSLDSIVGAGSATKGLDKIQPVPGVHGKIALDFDWGKKDEFVKALEVGMMLDLYYKRVPIMINSSNRFYQVALFVSFQFGKRW